MPPALEIKDLKKTYKSGTVALKGVSLTVPEGDFFALLGPNGAGKTTIIGIVTSLVNKTGGSVKVFGHDIDKEFEKAKTYIGLVGQEVNFNPFEKPLDIVINQAGYYGIPRSEAIPRAEKLLTDLGLGEKMKGRSMELSGGMKRRLMIARGLIHNPRFLILDEPTAGVDVEIRRGMWEFLTRTNAEGTTIILTTHYLEEAEQLCRNIAIINAGTIIQNTSMRALLSTLNHQTYVFNTIEPLIALPTFDSWTLTPLDPHTFELRIDNEHSLNDVFAQFDQKGIRIHSLRNKTNRLEELFMDLIHHDH